MSIDVGTLLEDRYRIQEKLGAGAMGAVFRAENTRIGRRVAIKILHPHVANIQGAAKRFELEARAAASAGSDHIIEIIDFGWVATGELFMVMELLEGETFKDRMKDSKRMNPHELIKICRQILKGLEKAHDAGIVHRDLKPDNVFLVREYANQKDWVKILDFGICRLAGDEFEPMTQTGMVLGTPHYMSPEHVRGSHHVDPRSDLYAVGVMMYRALVGAPPFHGSNVTELMFKIVYDPMPDMVERIPGVDRRLAAAVMKGMARDPNERYATAAEFERALAELASLPLDEATMPSHAAIGTPSTPPIASAASVPPRAEGSLTAKAEGSEGAHSIPLVMGKTAPGAEGHRAVEAAPAPKRSKATIAVAIAAIVGVVGGVAFFAHRQSAASATTASPNASGAPASPSTAAPAESHSSTLVAPVAESSPSTAPSADRQGPTIAPTNHASALSPSASPPVPSVPAPSAHPPAVTTGPPRVLDTPGIATDNPYK